MLHQLLVQLLYLVVYCAPTLVQLARHEARGACVAGECPVASRGDTRTSAVCTYAVHGIVQRCRRRRVLGRAEQAPHCEGTRLHRLCAPLTFGLPAAAGRPHSSWRLSVRRTTTRRRSASLLTSPARGEEDLSSVRCGARLASRCVEAGPAGEWLALCRKGERQQHYVVLSRLDVALGARRQGHQGTCCCCRPHSHAVPITTWVSQRA